MIGRTLGNYRILEKLGEGGMGEVYRAHDLRLDRAVALKFIRGDLLGDAEMRLRFEREARALAALDHPYVGAVHGFEEHGGEHFMVLALVEGRSLESILADGPLAPERAAVLLPRIAEAVAAAHRRGIVHRDIKSSNIVVGADDVPRLVDFGLALRERETRLTRVGETTVGTLATMAPEVLRGEPADARSDVFSLGMVFYEALTGRLPFQRPHPAIVMHAILNEELPAFPAALPAGSRRLEPIVRRCLEKDPARRFPDAGAVAEALGVAAPGGRSTSGGAHARGWRRAWPIAAAAVLLALAGLAASLTLHRRSGTASVPMRPRAVAVLEFENDTGDPSLDWMGRGLSELLAAALSRSDELDVYDAQRLTDLASGSARPGGPAGTFETLRNAGIGRAVLGSVVRSAGRLRIQGRVMDVETGRVLRSEWVEGRPGDDLFALAGGLMKGLQTALEVDLIGLETGDQWLREISTSSVDAFRLYLRGREAFLASRWAEAARDDEQALALDSTFVAARVDLTGCYWNLDDERRLAGSLRAADRLKGRAGRREALQIELIEAVVSGDPERLIRSAGELHQRYPENRFFTYLLGRGYFTAKRDSECLAVLEPLVRDRYEWAWTYVLTARAHDRLGHPDEARRHFELGMEVTHANPELAYIYSGFLAQHGDSAAARTLLERAGRSPGLTQTPYYESVIRVALARYDERAGRADSARAQYRRVLALAARGSDEAREAAEGLRRLGRR